MSTSGITSSMSSQMQQIQQEFQQLGQDLQSGNLTAAQSDFTTLQNDLPQTSSTSSSTSQSNNPIAQAFSQLSQDLQSGNLTAAQQDYSTIQQDFQNQASQTHSTIIITTSAEVRTVRLLNCSLSWVRICSLATCRTLSPTLALCSPYCRTTQAQAHRQGLPTPEYPLLPNRQNGSAIHRSLTGRGGASIHAPASGKAYLVQ